MSIKELQNQLAKFPEDMEVQFVISDGYTFYGSNATFEVNQNTLYIEGEE